MAGLWESVIAIVMKEAQDQAEALTTNALAEQSKRAVEYYHSPTYQEADLQNTFEYLFDDKESWEKRPKVCYNLTRSVTEKLSKIYSDPVKRVFPSSSDQTLWDEIAEQGFDPTMLDIDTTTTLSGTVAVRPYVDDKGQLLHYIYPGHQMEYVPDPIDPLKYVALRFSWDMAGQVVAHTWIAPGFLNEKDPGQFVETVDDKIQEEWDLSRYGNEVPIVVFRNKRPRWGFWGEPATDMVMANLTINSLLSDVNHTVKWQTHGQLIIVGAPTGFKPATGPSTYIAIKDPDGKVYYIQPEADVDAAIKAVNLNLELFLASRGIPKSAIIATEDRSKTSSGVRLVAEQASLREYRRDRITVFRPLDAELARISLKVYGVDGKKKGGSYEPERPSVEYKQIREPMDAADQAQWNFLFDNSVATPVDLIMERRGIEREDAEKVYKENQAFFNAQGLATKLTDEGDD